MSYIVTCGDAPNAHNNLSKPNKKHRSSCMVNTLKMLSMDLLCCMEHKHDAHTQMTIQYHSTLMSTK